MRTRVLFALFLPAVAGLAFACGDDDSTATPTSDAGPDTQTPPAPTPDSAAPDTGSDADDTVDVALSFAAKVGAETFACNKTFAGLGTAQTQVMPRDFRFYVHDVKLIRMDGAEVPLAVQDDGKWQYGGIALLDFENGADHCANGGTTDTNDTVKGRAPGGTYKGVKFTVGVPFALNHGNQATAPSPLNVGQMFWSWNGGYRFMKLDVQPFDPDAGDAGMGDGGAGMPRFNVHLGSTGCQGNPADGGGAVTSCASPNRFDVKLEVAQGMFDFAVNKIALDYAAVVSASNLTVNGGGPGGCMSFPGDPECPDIFGKLGLDYATGTASGAQSVFSIE